MGISIRNIGKKIWEFATPQDEEAIRRANASSAAANQRIQSLGNNARGVLGQQPARQQFVQNNRAPNFSLLKATQAAFADTLTDPSKLANAPKVNVGQWKGSGFVEDLINSPFKVAEGNVRTYRGLARGELDQVKQGMGQVIAGAIEGPTGFVPVGKVAQAGSKGAKLLPKAAAFAKQGIKEGAIYGSAYGAGNAASQNASYQDIAKSAVIGGVVGGTAGGVIGGGAPVVVKGVQEGSKAAVKAAVTTTKATIKAADKLDQVAFNKTTLAQADDAIRQAVRNREAAAVQGANKRQMDWHDKNIEQLTQQKYNPTQVGSVQVGKAPSGVASGAVDDTAYRMAQDKRAQLYDQGAGTKAKNTVSRNVYDPRNVEQQLDNTEFSRRKSAGEVQSGQKELLPEDSLAVQRGRIQNPHRAAEVRNKERFDGGEGKSYSINDVIKHYGKESSDKARSFENYRIYKDELWRMENGAPNTLGVDPAKMAEYVVAHEAANPLAKSHNAALREAALQELIEKNKARIDPPELLERARVNPYYTPRDAIDPEGLRRPKMSGGVRSGAKTTKARQETAGGPVRSPLSLFRQNNSNLERSLAEQRYGSIIKSRTDAGDLPGARVVVDAESVSIRKQLLEEAKKFIAPVKKNSVKLANKRADARNATLLKNQANLKAANKARALLLDQVKDPDARAAISGMSNKELVETFKYLVADGATNVERIRARLIKTNKNAETILNDIDGLRAQIAQDQTEASALRSGAAEFTQRNERGVQTITYKLDGETGKIEIPADLAESLSKQNEMMNQGLVERGLKPVAAAQKLTWTGFLMPAFKLWNVLVKNPLLMYRNADGLSGIRPAVLTSTLEQILHTPKLNQFKKDMLSRNMASENALQTVDVHSVAADDIAARANLATFFNRNPVRTMSDVWRGISAVFASVDNAQRYSVAYGAYKRAKDKGFTEKQALDIASQAPAKVFGDFDRVTRLAQALEVVIPYSGATQAGFRASVRASKTKPISTTAKDAILLSGMVGLTAYSLQNNAEYYKDMIDSNKKYVLDNNWTIVLPGAKPVLDANGKKTGFWDGVIQIPLTPDFRPANRAAWETTYKVANGDAPDVKLLAGEILNQVTGDMSNNIYAQEKSDHGKNILNGILPMSPIANMGRTMAGVNVYNGKPLADEFLASKPRTEQSTDTTSPGAKTASKLTGGVFTPQQADQIFGMLGTTGDVLQQKEDSAPGDTILTSLVKPLRPGKGLSDRSKSGKNYAEDLDAVGKTIENKDDFKAFQILTGKNTERTPDDSAAKAKELLARSDLLRAMSDMNDRKKARGEDGDPFFDLTSEQQQKVLRYRGSKDLNSAKQAYDKDGTPLFTALGLDEKWYADFKDKEDASYEKIKQENTKSMAALNKEKATANPQREKAIDKEIESLKKSVNSGSLTYSGAKKPDDKKIKPIEEAYYALAKGSGARKAYLAAHPELLEYWAQGNQFTDAERVALGLKLSEDKYAGGKSGGGSGGSGGGSSNSVDSPYKYAVYVKGSVPKGKMTINKSSGAKIKPKTFAKAKVTIKKSLV